MKRFTETQKWEDPWFRKLKPEMKLLWQWLLDRCDNAGVIDPDIDLASFQIGYQYPMDTLLGFGDRVVKLPGGKHFIPKFISFQYGKLSEDCKAHNPIFLSLEKHGLKGYPKGIHTLQEMEEDKETEKEEVKPRARGTVSEFKAFAKEIQLPESDGEYLFNHLQENGWKRGNAPIRDWRSSMRKWKIGKYLPSQKLTTLRGNFLSADVGLSKNFTSDQVGI